MTVSEIRPISTPTGARPAYEPVALDLYRDIHKGIRAELFAVTNAAGNIDAADSVDRGAVAEHVDAVVDLLVAHAEHEDAQIQPVLETEVPELAEQIASDHGRLEIRMDLLRDLAGSVVAASETGQRSAVQHLYLELGSFAGAYLEHQDLEERVVMPALDSAIGFDAVVGIHEAIISSIPPHELAASLAVMLPAMNVDDRVEMLGGMRAGAPPEAFGDIWSLAGSVLAPADHAAVAARLGIE